MGFTKFTNDMEIISKLADRPNDTDGLSAAQLKARFDEAGVALKDFINETLLNELESGEGASSIGIDTITGMAARNVQAALAELKAAIQTAAELSIPDNSVSTVKIQSGAVTSEKIAEGAVTETRIADGSIVAAKLDTGAVTASKIRDHHVTTAKLADSSVTEAKLSDSSVTTAKIKDKQITTAKLADGFVLPLSKGGLGATTAAGARDNLGAQAAIRSSSFNLSSTTGWTQRSGGGYTNTIDLAGITNNFVASPDTEAGWKIAQDANLYPPTVDATNHRMTFTSDRMPTGSIHITVYFW